MNKSVPHARSPLVCLRVHSHVSAPCPSRPHADVREQQEVMRHDQCVSFPRSLMRLCSSQSPVTQLITHQPLVLSTNRAVSDHHHHRYWSSPSPCHVDVPTSHSYTTNFSLNTANISLTC